MSRPVRSERVTRAQQHCQLEKSLQFLLRDCSASYEFATSVWIQGLSLGQSPKCLTVASKSKKKSFPFTPFWSSNCESMLAAHAHGTAVPKQISALHWDISLLATLSLQIVRARCTFKNLSASSHSKGKKPNQTKTELLTLSSCPCMKATFAIWKRQTVPKLHTTASPFPYSPSRRGARSPCCRCTRWRPCCPPGATAAGLGAECDRPLPAPPS